VPSSLQLGVSEPFNQKAAARSISVPSDLSEECWESSIG